MIAKPANAHLPCSGPLLPVLRVWHVAGTFSRFAGVVCGSEVIETPGGWIPDRRQR